MDHFEDLLGNLNNGASLTLNGVEQQTLQRLRPLLARSPHDLLAILLGQGEVEEPAWEWSAPLPLTRVHDE